MCSTWTSMTSSFHGAAAMREQGGSAAYQNLALLIVFLVLL